MFPQKRLDRRNAQKLSQCRKECASNATFPSFLYFSTTMGNGAWSKFSGLFFLAEGVTPSQLAIINSVQSVAKLIGYPALRVTLSPNNVSTFHPFHYFHIQLHGKQTDSDYLLIILTIPKHSCSFQSL